MNNTEFQIIKLPPERWNEYKELRLRALKEDPQAFGSSYEEQVQKPDTYWQDRLKGWLLFAQADNKLVGMIGAFIKEGSDVPEIIAVYVVSEARGKGVSKALMSGILEELSQNKVIKKVKLGVNVNQTSAVKLYESYSFKIVGKENAKLGDGKYYDEYLMEKDL